jgi:hypothetical protein
MVILCVTVSPQRRQPLKSHSLNPFLSVLFRPLLSLLPQDQHPNQWSIQVTSFKPKVFAFCSLPTSKRSPISGTVTKNPPPQLLYILHLQTVTPVNPLESAFAKTGGCHLGLWKDYLKCVAISLNHSHLSGGSPDYRSLPCRSLIANSSSASRYILLSLLNYSFLQRWRSSGAAEMPMRRSSSW